MEEKSILNAVTVWGFRHSVVCYLATASGDRFVAFASHLKKIILDSSKPDETSGKTLVISRMRAGNGFDRWLEELVRFVPEVAISHPDLA